MVRTWRPLDGWAFGDTSKRIATPTRIHSNINSNMRFDRMPFNVTANVVDYFGFASSRVCVRVWYAIGTRFIHSPGRQLSHGRSIWIKQHAKFLPQPSLTFYRFPLSEICLRISWKILWFALNTTTLPALLRKIETLLPNLLATGFRALWQMAFNERCWAVIVMPTQSCVITFMCGRVRCPNVGSLADGWLLFGRFSGTPWCARQMVSTKFRFKCFVGLSAVMAVVMALRRLCFT